MLASSYQCNICLSGQLFWERKLSGLNAFDIAEELVKTMDLPKGLQGEDKTTKVEFKISIFCSLT